MSCRGDTPSKWATCYCGSNFLGHGPTFGNLVRFFKLAFTHTSQVVFNLSVTTVLLSKNLDDSNRRDSSGLN